jgi:hypothetical protein
MELATDGNLAERLHPHGHDRSDKQLINMVELLQVLWLGVTAATTSMAQGLFNCNSCIHCIELLQI